MKIFMVLAASVVTAAGFAASGCSDEACHTETGCEATHSSAGGGEVATGGSSTAQGGGGAGGDAAGVGGNAGAGG